MPGARTNGGDPLSGEPSLLSPDAAGRGLDVIVPIYRRAELARRCIESLLDNLGEIAFLSPRLVLINDSPNDLEVAALLADLAAGYPEQVLAITNAENLGFVRSVNAGLEMAIEAGRHALLVNSDTVTFAGTLLNIFKALSFDPQIGFVSPRSNNASICTLPHSADEEPVDPDQAHARWQRLAPLLPEVHFIPTAVGFYLLIRHDVLVNFGVLSDAFGRGYEEENDLVMRANKAGVRAAMANRAFAYHAGSASFKLTDINVQKQREENLRKLEALHPEFLPLVRRYENSAHYKAERLIDGLLPSASGGIRVAVDLTQLGLHADGTSEVSISLLRELAAGGGLELTAVCEWGVFEFHKLGQIPGVAHAAPSVAARYAVAIRTAQPFDPVHLARTESLAPIVIYLMHDTIAQDCGYLDLTYQPSALWAHVAKHSSGIAFVSSFSAQVFRNRYGAAAENHLFVRLWPTKLKRQVRSSSPSERPYVLVLGNKFLHKDVERAARMLSTAYPAVDFCVLTDRAHTSANVRTFRAGTLPGERIQHLYRHAAVIVAPSHVEGFGLGIVHALSAGRPVLARRIPATLEILETYSRMQGVFLFDDSGDMVRKLKLALAAERSEIDDSDCAGWPEWAAAFREFLTERLADKDIFTRLVERLEALDALCAQRASAAGTASATPQVQDSPPNDTTIMTPNKRSKYSGPPSEWPAAEQLFGLEGIDFVNALYRSVLGRPADADGGRYYLERLRRGASKYQLFREIAASDEAAAAGVDLEAILRSGYLGEKTTRLAHGLLGRWRRRKSFDTADRSPPGPLADRDAAEAGAPAAATTPEQKPTESPRASPSATLVTQDAVEAATAPAPQEANAGSSLPARTAAHDREAQQWPPEVPNLVRMLDGKAPDAARDQSPARCAIDAAIVSPGAGLLLVGWIDDSRAPLELIRVAGGNWAVALDGARIVRLRRVDVENALPQRGHHLFGFLAFLNFTEPDIDATRPLTIELVQRGGRATTVSCPVRGVDEYVLRNTVLSSIAKLEFFQNSPAERVACLAAGVGAEIVRLNREITTRLTANPYLERFGRQDLARRGSIIVCLYGKLEYFFLQNCLFSQLPGIDDYEFIYVSNSPELADPLLREARSTSLTYGLTCSVMILPGNAGFGAANNAAAKVARSDRIMMVNPDVFPRDPDWARKHSQVLDNEAADRTRLFGVPLYYENGSLMHAGMYFEVEHSMAMPEGTAPRLRRTCRTQHYGKGAPPDTLPLLRSRPVPAITGAFISIQRDLFEQLEGFTEDFVFGHYEDADLCLRALEKGTAPWIHDIRLWHLEGRGSTRQPEHEGASVVNRWIFTERWLNVIEGGLLGPNPTHPMMAVEDLQAPATAGTVKLAGKRLQPRK